MHDLFDIVGLPRSAPPVEVRRAFARRVRRLHPDFGASDHSDLTAGRPPVSYAAVRCEVAVDFIEMTTVLDRMQRAFFRNGGIPLF